MPKKTFSDPERYAVWTVHGERCWLCGLPMSYAEAQIDHILPEELEGTEELKGILADFGLPADFNLNGWSNWLPAHGHCNLKKREHRFSPAPIILRHIEHAAKHAPRAQELHDGFTTSRRVSIAFARVLEAIKSGDISHAQLDRLTQAAALDHAKNRAPDMAGRPIMLAPGLVIVSEDATHYMLQAPSGLTGFRPKGDDLHSSWDCPNCGVTGWNGTRCIRCGWLIDPD